MEHRWHRGAWPCCGFALGLALVAELDRGRRVGPTGAEHSGRMLRGTRYTGTCEESGLALVCYSLHTRREPRALSDIKAHYFHQMPHL